MKYFKPDIKKRNRTGLESLWSQLLPQLAVTSCANNQFPQVAHVPSVASWLTIFNSQKVIIEQALQLYFSLKSLLHERKSFLQSRSLSNVEINGH